MKAIRQTLNLDKVFWLTYSRKVSEVQVLEIHDDGDCKLKDIVILENYKLFDLIRFGRGEDFDLGDL